MLADEPEFMAVIAPARAFRVDQCIGQI